MRYRYVAAYNVEGVTQPSGSEDRLIVEFPEINALARIVVDIDDFLSEVDRQSAIGSLILRGVVGQSDEGSLEERISAAMENLQRIRRETMRPGLVLVFEATGECQSFEVASQRELPDFFVALDGTPREEIRSSYLPILNGLLASFALACETVNRLTTIADNVLFRTDDDKPIYAYTLSVSATATISSTLQVESLELVANSAGTLAREQDLISPARLMVKSLSDADDRLLAFLSAWAGLEIFVNKSFPEYERRAFERLASPERFRARTRDVMKDKYGLVDKFSLIAFELDASGDTDKDEPAFKEIKGIRDRVMHGEDISPTNLPTEKLRSLLRKYLKLHSERIRS